MKKEKGVRKVKRKHIVTILSLMFVLCFALFFVFQLADFLDKKVWISEVSDSENNIGESEITGNVASGPGIDRTVQGYQLYNEETVSTAYTSYAAVSINADTKGQPHIFFGAGGGSWVRDAHKINNVWRVSQSITATNLHTALSVVDKSNRLWAFSFSLDNPTASYIYIINNVDTNPTLSVSPTIDLYSNWGSATPAYDPYYPNNVFTSYGGTIYKFETSGSGAATGTTVYPGQGGEKFDFKIAPRSGQAGIYHTANGGWDNDCSGYINSAMSSRVCWANFANYPEMNDDGSYIGLGIDLTNPNVAYMAGPYGGNDRSAVGVNIWDGDSMMYSASDLYIADQDAADWGTGRRRFTFSWAPSLGGGAWLCWTGSDSHIKLKYFHYSGEAAFGDTVDVGAGTQCAIASDSSGNLHIVYLNGGVKYRKMLNPSACRKPGQVTHEDTPCIANKMYTDPPSVRGRLKVNATGLCKIGTMARTCSATNQWVWSNCTNPYKGQYNETCNGMDDNCDGEIDEGCDDDGDGYLDGNMTCGGEYKLAFQNTVSLPVPGDYDGDGKIDFAIVNKNTYNWTIRLAAGGNIKDHLGSKNDIPVPGFYDNDNKTDLAFWKPRIGRWVIKKSSDGDIIKKEIINLTESQGFIPAQADYDGDNQTDYALYSLNNSKWRVYESSNRYRERARVAFGANRSLPAPADYDGDGKTDLAYYLPIESKFIIRKSSDNQTVRRNFFTNVSPSVDPIPADYDGDGKANLAVFANGVWMIECTNCSGLIALGNRNLSNNKGCFAKDLNDNDANITAGIYCRNDSNCPEDNNTCTNQRCDLTRNICVFDFNNNTCDDNQWCTINDSCSLGSCRGTPKICADDNITCTIPYCSEEQDKCLMDVSSCQCTDDANCTDDNNLCTEVKCVNRVCVTRSLNVSCNDNNNCTINDVCSNSSCSGVLKNINDNNTNTYDACLPNGTVIHELIISDNDEVINDFDNFEEVNDTDEDLLLDVEVNDTDDDAEPGDTTPGAEEEGSYWWIWVLVVLIIAVIGIIVWFKFKKEDEIQNKKGSGLNPQNKPGFPPGGNPMRRPGSMLMKPSQQFRQMQRPISNQ